MCKPVGCASKAGAIVVGCACVGDRARELLLLLMMTHIFVCFRGVR